MKVSTIGKGLVLSLMLLAVTAFAAEKGNIELYSSASVGGKQLAAGRYTVEWQGNGPNVQLSILKGKKVLATTAAHMVDTPAPSERDAVVIKAGDNGASSVSEIRFQGKKFVLDVDNGEPAGSSGSNGSGMR